MVKQWDEVEGKFRKGPGGLLDSTTAPTQPLNWGDNDSHPRGRRFPSAAGLISPGVEGRSRSYEQMLGLLDSIQRRLFVMHDRGDKDSEEMALLLDVIHRESVHLANRVGAQLIAERVRAGEYQLNRSPVKVSMLMDSVLDYVGPKAAYKGIQLLSEWEQPGTISGDEELLRSMFVHLLENIIQLSNRGSHIETRAYHKGKKSIVLVSSPEETRVLQFLPDPTMGIPWVRSEDEAETILFDLGLLAMQPILEVHKGEFHFEPNRGSGLTVQIALPLHDSSPRIRQGGRKILVIDDDLVGSMLLEQTLRKSGYETVRASNGLEGLAMAQWDEIGLVILDVMLPGIDGFEVCHRLRSSSKTAEMPIIMVSAKNSHTDRTTGLRVGATDYLTKPVNIAKLQTVIYENLPPRRDYD